MKAFGHLCSVWRSKTARVGKRAVTINEMTFYRLKVGLWYKKVIRSSDIKIKEGDCFFYSIFFGTAADLAKSELIILPGNHDLSLI